MLARVRIAAQGHHQASAFRPLWRRSSTQTLSSSSYRIQRATARQKHLEIRWDDNHISRFHWMWLRDHCPQSRHPTSLQRQLDTITIPCDINAAGLEVCADSVRLVWDENAASKFEAGWLREHCYSSPSRLQRIDSTQREAILWDSRLKEHLPATSCHDLLAEGSRGEEALWKCLSSLQVFGVALLQQSPSDLAGTERVARRIGRVRETFYGRMWDTAPKPGGEVNDTAYTNLALPPHTDCAYLAEPPGLQVFNCVAQCESDPTGGSTVLVDGFKVAKVLEEQSPEAFHFFCQTPLPFHCLEEGVHVVAEGTVFERDPIRGHVTKFRYNNDDRAPLTNLSEQQVEDFYKHLRTLTELVRSPQLECLLKLSPGHMVILNNQRVLHGRRAFHGYRNMLGCYMFGDDWKSHLRLLERSRTNSRSNSRSNSCSNSRSNSRSSHSNGQPIPKQVLSNVA